MNDLLPADARCQGCTYALRGLPNPICPECGRSFDPADWRTFRSETLQHLTGFFDSPPPLAVCVVFALITSLYLWALSEPGGTTIVLLGCVVAPFCAVPFTFFVLIGDYLLRANALRGRRQVPCEARRTRRRRRVRWLVVPIGLMLIFSGFATRWPLLVRFHLSKPAMERFITRNTATGGKFPSAWIGLYWFDELHIASDGSATFDTQGGPGLVGFWFIPGSQGSDGLGRGWSSRDDPF